MKKFDGLKTERLRLVPLSDETLQQRLYDAETPVEKRRYSELYSMVRLYPTYRLWCTLWEIRRRGDDVCVGEFFFDGPANERGEAWLHCEIVSAHQGQGYAGEALKEVLHWAWKDDRAYFILSRPHDSAYGDTLRKLGFQEEIGRFEIERPVKPQTQTMMSIGVSMGLLAGILVLGNVNAGILIGALAGALLGGWLDAKDRRMRERLRALRK